MPLLVAKYAVREGPFRALQKMADDPQPTGLFPLVVEVMKLVGRSPAPHHVEFDAIPYSDESRNIPSLKVTLNTSTEPLDTSVSPSVGPWDKRLPMVNMLATGISLAMLHRTTGTVRVVLETGGSNAEIGFAASSGEILSVWNLPSEIAGRRLGTF